MSIPACGTSAMWLYEWILAYRTVGYLVHQAIGGSHCERGIWWWIRGASNSRCVFHRHEWGPLRTVFPIVLCVRTTYPSRWGSLLLQLFQMLIFSYVYYSNCRCMGKSTRYLNCAAPDVTDLHFCKFVTSEGVKSNCLPCQPCAGTHTICVVAL